MISYLRFLAFPLLGGLSSFGESVLPLVFTAICCDFLFFWLVLCERSVLFQSVL